MESDILRRLDRMITKHELVLAKLGARQGAVPADLLAEVDRLEKALYALCEGVRGFLRAKDCGFPLDRFDGYLQSIEGVAVEIEKSMSSHIAELEAFLKPSQHR
jgi:hypothetical protein